MNWFGEPWPNARRPAPVCANSADQVETPIGVLCTGCTYEIGVGDQGVLIPLWVPDRGYPAMAVYHIQCMLADVVGPELAALAWRQR
jgi:hypothetical protein